MREHCHGETGGAADLYGVGIRGLQSEVFCKHRGEHQVRHRGRVPAYQAVHFGALELRIGQRRSARIAHQIERAASGMLAESRQSDSGDPAQGDSRS